MKNPLRRALYMFDSLLGGYFGQYLEVRSLEFFVAWGEATRRPRIGRPLKALFIWFCGYFTGRVVPSRDSLEGSPRIMPYEDVITLVRRARVGELHPCSCKSYNIPDDGAMPRDTCMGFQFVEGIDDIAREGYHDDFRVKEEIIGKIRECEDYGLVHQIMTVSRPTGRKGYVLCNCDGKSCIPMILYLRYGIPMVRGSGLTAAIRDGWKCRRCGKCVSRCVFGAALPGADGPSVSGPQCLGCGLCIGTCPEGIRFMERI